MDSEALLLEFKFQLSLLSYMMSGKLPNLFMLQFLASQTLIIIVTIIGLL